MFPIPERTAELSVAVVTKGRCGRREQTDNEGKLRSFIIKNTNTHIYMCWHVCMCVYIYIYIFDEYPGYGRGPCLAATTRMEQGDSSL